MVSLIELFREYVKWKVLAHFLANPNSHFHIRQLAGALKVSPASASAAARSFERDGMLSKEEKGLAHLYRLNAESPAVAPLKKAYGLALVLSAGPEAGFLDADTNIISLALFGSYADGSFDEKSDVDFLAVTPTEKERLVEAAKKLEGLLGKEVGLSVFKPGEWRLLAKKRDAFYKKVVGNHILLHGAGLI